MPGLGPAKYAQIHAALELARRHLRESLSRGKPLTSPQATREYLRAALRDRPHEVFCALMLDTRHRVIAFEELVHRHHRLGPRSSAGGGRKKP